MLKYTRISATEFEVSAQGVTVKATFNPARGKVYADAWANNSRYNMMEDVAVSYEGAVGIASGWLCTLCERRAKGETPARPAPEPQAEVIPPSPSGLQAIPGQIRHPAGTWQGAIERLPPQSVLVDKIGDARKAGYVELWAHPEVGYYVITNGDRSPFYWDWRRVGREAPKMFRERSKTWSPYD